MKDIQAARRAALEKGLLGGPDCVRAGGSLDRQGYGTARWKGVQTTAHVVVWRLAGRDVPEGMTIDHGCHDPATCAGGNTCPHRACVNIDHLRLASPAEQSANSVKSYQDFCINGHPWPESRYVSPTGHKVCRLCQADGSRQRIAKKRETVPPKLPGLRPGEAHPQAILTEAIVLEARTRAAAGERISDLARDFGVKYDTLFSAVRGMSWKHLPNPINNTKKRETND